MGCSIVFVADVILPGIVANPLTGGKFKNIDGEVTEKGWETWDKIRFLAAIGSFFILKEMDCMPEVAAGAVLVYGLSYLALRTKRRKSGV